MYDVHKVKQHTHLHINRNLDAFELIEARSLRVLLFACACAYTLTHLLWPFGLHAEAIAEELCIRQQIDAVVGRKVHRIRFLGW